MVLVEGLAGAGQLGMQFARMALAERAARQRHQPASGERHRQADDAAKHVRAQPGGGPGHRRAPVVADDHGLAFAERLHDADHVVDQPVDAVVLEPGELRRTTVAALVDRHRAVAGGGQRVELMPPRVPGLRETMHQQHQRPLPLLDGMDAGSVDGEQMVLALGHGGARGQETAVSPSRSPQRAGPARKTAGRGCALCRPIVPRELL